MTQQLSAYDKSNRYVFYNTSESIVDKIKFFLNIVNIDIVYSISASISGGGALNLALRFNKKIVQHFIGSDVLSAQNDFKTNNVNSYLVERSTYLCEVDWIKDELEAISIKSDVVSIAVYDKNPISQQPKKFSVLTYIGKGKEEFYGIDTLIEVANVLDDIEFKIAGIDSYNKELPDNIKLLGWIDMDKEFQNSVCYIRNAKHDGLAFSLLEALGYGKIVFYNYKFPYTNYFANSDGLIKQIQNVKNQFDKNKLDINHKAIDFIKTEYSKDKVLGNLVLIFKKKNIRNIL